MRLFGWRHLPLVLTLLLACDDGTAPPPAITARYGLESINGSPPPVTIHSRDGYTATVIWSTLSFDAAGKAALVERMRYTYPDEPPIEVTQTTGYSYRTVGNTIEFEYSPPCDDIAVCIGPPTGEMAASSLTLVFPGNPPYRPASLYRSLGLE
jgi:hypothetical protein